MAKKNFKIKNNDFELDTTISKDDFKFVKSDSKSHEQKFQTKPTTFLKDSLKRFAKNKSSVVASGVLGVLLLMAVFVPLFGHTDAAHDTKNAHTELKWLEPKLFESGTGFWDGTKKYSDIPVDTKGSTDRSLWTPGGNFEEGAVKKITFSDKNYIKDATKFGDSGYVQFGYMNNLTDDNEYVYMKTKSFPVFDISSNHYLTSFETFDENKLVSANEKTPVLPKEYTLGESAVYFVVEDPNDSATVLKEVEIVGYDTVHSLNESNKINISSLVSSKGFGTTTFEKVHFEIRVKNSLNHKNTCALIRNISFDTESGDASFSNQLLSASFVDGNDCLIRTNDNLGVWTFVSPSIKKAYLCQAYTCSFVYDTYEAALGKVKVDGGIPNTKINEYINNKWIKLTFSSKKVDGVWVVDESKPFVYEVLNSKKNPIAEEIKPEHLILEQSFGKLSKVDCKVYKYKYIYNLDTMPKFIMGTDKSGRDMFIFVFEGLLTSLGLGIITAAVCFIFGLIYGSISGYFGGTVDLIMERFTDILSGIPWIVVMTLIIINLGSSPVTFGIALCLTGWIGTAATTRTQFYRFRGREYVLASRTLGASHPRLIAKHILPNAMGTIITSAVLMVPSVIFSEATISYLGLGLKNLASLGVILSDNQAEINSNPYLLIFPSVIIALLMISFNLFGNGLRDAVNPSLKGEGE